MVQINLKQLKKIMILPPLFQIFFFNLPYKNFDLFVRGQHFPQADDLMRSQCINCNVSVS